MKPTFLRQMRPFVTGMIAEETVKDTVVRMKKSIYEGADALAVQLCRMEQMFKTEENYRKIFAAAAGRPVYVTNYRLDKNKDKTDDACMEELMTALRCGGTLGDVAGSAFDCDSGMGIGLELSMKRDAIDKQMRVIDRIHQMGKEVLMSSHVLKFTDAETVLEIAFEQKKRGADIVKIVTAGNSDEEEMENLRITSLLKKELRSPFIFLSGGTHSKIHRMIGPMLGCYSYYAVCDHERAVPTQPTIRAARAVLQNFDYLPDLVYED